jgi:transglutaminase-like putative cysteine protease
MKYEISHRTTYNYVNPVARSHHILHLRPRESDRQRLLKHSLLIEPAPLGRNEIIDYFGNTAELLRIDEEHHEFVVHARSTVDVTAPGVVALEQSSAWDADQRDGTMASGPVDPDVVQFKCHSRQTPITQEVVNFARASFPEGRPVLEGAMHLTRRIFETFSFDPTATDISTPIAHVLTNKRGVCQDFAHLSLAALRSLGIPTRYVSGYLLTLPPPGHFKLKGADASHAWISVWSREFGWVDFDPTNGIIPSRDHITLAIGRDYDDISPISGVLLGGGKQTMAVAVDVELAA